MGRYRPLTDQRIVDLVRAGVSADELVWLIATAPEISFDLSPAATDAIMKVGVQENIIRAMAAKEAGVSEPMRKVAAARPIASAPVPAPLNVPLVPEVGVYNGSNQQWVKMMPEVVNWRPLTSSAQEATLSRTDHGVYASIVTSFSSGVSAALRPLSMLSIDASEKPHLLRPKRLVRSEPLGGELGIGAKSVRSGATHIDYRPKIRLSLSRTTISRGLPVDC
jgi:hypothetical protein